MSKKSLAVSFPVLASAMVWFEFENPVIIYFAEVVVFVPSDIETPSFRVKDTKSPSLNPCSTKSKTSVVNPEL